MKLLTEPSSNKKWKRTEEKCFKCLLSPTVADEDDARSRRMERGVMLSWQPPVALLSKTASNSDDKRIQAAPV